MFHCPVGVWVIEQHAIILSATVRSPTVCLLYSNIHITDYFHQNPFENILRNITPSFLLQYVIPDYCSLITNTSLTQVISNLREMEGNCCPSSMLVYIRISVWRKEVRNLPVAQTRHDSTNKIFFINVPRVSYMWLQFSLNFKCDIIRMALFWRETKRLRLDL